MPQPTRACESSLGLAKEQESKETVKMANVHVTTLDKSTPEANDHIVMLDKSASEVDVHVVRLG